MRDISKKTKTFRTATALAVVNVNPQTIALIREGKIPKGDPLPVAKVAAIQAAKNTSQIIPYCHPLPIDFVDCRFELGTESIQITSEVKAVSKTGVEMEALTAATVAALTIYDMIKAVDKAMEIVGVKLIAKRGGKSDYRDSFETPLRAAVLVMSDSIAGGQKKDIAGKHIVERLKAAGVEVLDYRVIPDEPEQIEQSLKHYADTLKLDLVLTTGGTGLGPRDTTPEVTAKVIEKEIPAIPETARAYGQERTPYAMLSRGKAGVRGRTIIVNLPGSRRGAEESLDALMPGLFHVFKILASGGHEDARHSE
ncbi:MAG: bifunctional molybdenum cofactor biosynthesis protein MoaC/MoaB [Ignavibacteria bacterium]|nr:bifunctional molybdenum cofactor biosynthesis protein MoaC/MoaB [Ignavibacteria bacterium]